MKPRIRNPLGVQVVIILISLALWVSPSPGQPPLPDIQEAEQRFSQGLVLYFSADYAGAIEAFEEASQLKPDEARTYYFMGYAYYEMGDDMERARAAFEKAFEIDKDYQPPSPSQRMEQGGIQ